ncbi:hypothetical protein BV898_01635 [Hypsibius exemplaris]|uniref:PAW domain-containing protein n=1 Tax=Hypsibius exemplaris TaxID=2072580 RepID=A0A1W0XAM3_HYPEX|nr:hypothetical protein BV898_01635 [Hypsibius exemplaris]
MDGRGPPYNPYFQSEPALTGVQQGTLPPTGPYPSGSTPFDQNPAYPEVYPNFGLNFPQPQPPFPSTLPYPSHTTSSSYSHNQLPPGYPVSVGLPPSLGAVIPSVRPSQAPHTQPYPATTTGVPVSTISSRNQHLSAYNSSFGVGGGGANTTAHFQSPQHVFNSAGSQGAFGQHQANFQDPAHGIVGVVLEPTPRELGEKKMILQYCSSADRYIRPVTNSVSQGWNMCVFTASNISRNFSNERKKYFLARRPNAPHGRLEWRFDVSSSGTRIKSVRAKFNAKIQFKGLGREFIDVYILAPSNERVHLNFLGIEQKFKSLKGQQKFSLVAEISGTTAPAQWDQKFSKQDQQISDLQNQILLLRGATAKEATPAQPEDVDVCSTDSQTPKDITVKVSRKRSPSPGFGSPTARTSPRTNPAETTAIPVTKRERSAEEEDSSSLPETEKSKSAASNVMSTCRGSSEKNAVLFRNIHQLRWDSSGTSKTVRNTRRTRSGGPAVDLQSHGSSRSGVRPRS